MGRSERQLSVDEHVGSRVRQRRIILGMGQKRLGEAIGVRFQQVQKYEHGANRVSGSMLYKLSLTLRVPVSYFFDDMPSPDAPKPRSASAASTDLMTNKETLELVRAYFAIPATAREGLYELVKSISRAMSGSTTPPRNGR